MQPCRSSGRSSSTKGGSFQPPGAPASPANPRWLNGLQFGRARAKWSAWQQTYDRGKRRSARGNSFPTMERARMRHRLLQHGSKALVGGWRRVARARSRGVHRLPAHPRKPCHPGSAAQAFGAAAGLGRVQHMLAYL